MFHEDSAVAINIGRVAVKVPPFWRPKELDIVGDIILNPPAEKPYTTLLIRLCSQYADSKEQRLRDLISGILLNDRKPSRLLLEMRNKAVNRISEELLKTLFLQRLPIPVQQILAILNDQLVEIADGIMVVAGYTSSIDAQNQDLKTMLMDISSLLSRLETRKPERHFRRLSKNRNFGNQEHCWLYLSDRTSKSEFLIGTEANISVVSLTLALKHRPSVSLELLAVNGTAISTYGQRLLTLDLGLRRVFRWPFIIAAVSQPIIRAHFFLHHGLLIE
ncbi:retrovirus-related Pol polyprotein from transposon 297 [Nephila pilipes]|uniref:Retrovirus-related Pol polyprotein from transposon 297 n=1 Tax=Nephila pilipes TaxID=299642 RepID=A0A8X6IHG7_NEPPI|nr:retrovirus-related Pol polyprotein from transposon 297 [Nephila pilipes]